MEVGRREKRWAAMPMRWVVEIVVGRRLDFWVVAVVLGWGSWEEEEGSGWWPAMVWAWVWAWHRSELWMEKVKVVTRAARIPCRESVVVGADFLVLVVVVGSPWMVQRWFQRGWSDKIAARDDSLSLVVDAASCFDIWLR